MQDANKKLLIHILNTDSEITANERAVLGQISAGKPVTTNAEERELKRLVSAKDAWTRLNWSKTTFYGRRSNFKELP